MQAPHKYKPFILLLVLLFCSNAMAFETSEFGEIENCKDFLAQVSEKYDDLSTGVLVRAFDETYDSCKSNKDYIVIFSSQLSLNHEVDRAKQIIKTFKIENPNNKNDKEILFAEINSEYMAIVALDGESFVGNLSRSTENKLKQIEMEFMDFVMSYPEWFLPHANLSSLNLLLGNYGTSIRYAETANGLEPSYSAYRNIIVASFQLKRDRDVIDTMDFMFSLYPETLEDKDIVLATSKAYVNLNELVLARNTLIYFLQKKPEFEQDAEIHKAIEYIKIAYEKSK